MSRLILHITTRAAWEAARAAGRYEAPSLASEGFIHLSDPEQVLRVADARYSGVPGRRGRPVQRGRGGVRTAA